MSEEKQGEVIAENAKNITHVDHNTVFALQINKRKLAKVIDGEYRKLQISDCFPYTLSACSHVITEYGKLYQQGKVTATEVKAKFSRCRDGLEGHFIDINLNWEEYERAAIADYKGQHGSLQDEVYRLRFHPPIKHLPYAIEKDGETLLWRDTTPIRIYGISKSEISKTQDPTLNLTDRFGKKITSLVVRVKWVLVANLFKGLTSGIEQCFIPEDLAFYAGLVDVTRHSKDIAGLVKRTGFSVSLFWNAILYLRFHDNHTGEEKSVDLIDFWGSISAKEIAEKTDKDGNTKIYLRNGKARSLRFFETLCILLQEYDNRHRGKFSASNVHFCGAELAEGNTIRVKVDREYSPRKWHIEEQIARLLGN